MVTFRNVGGVLLVMVLVLLGPVTVRGFAFKHNQRLLPLRGDCSQIKPLTYISPRELQAKEYIVMYDSHVDFPHEMCAKFILRWDKAYLHTTEIVYFKEYDDATFYRMHYESKRDKKGFYFDGQGGVSLILNVDRKLSAICFLECAPMGEGFGGHVFCGSLNGRFTRELEVTYRRSREVLPFMDIDLEMQPMNTKCEF